MSETWGLIPARLDSSRLHGKALLNLHSLPMIVHVAKRAGLAQLLDQVVVCTDSDQIAQVCLDFEIDVCLTSSDCRNGTERIFEAAKALGCRDSDLIIDIQGDEPLVDPACIDRVVEITTQKKSEFDIFLPHLENCAPGNSNVVKVVSSRGRVLYLTRSDSPHGFALEQPLKKHLSVIGFSYESLDLFASSGEGELERLESIELLRALECGMSIFTFPLNADSFSVDVQEDFYRAEKAIEKCPLYRRHYANSTL